MIHSTMLLSGGTRTERQTGRQINIRLADVASPAVFYFACKNTAKHKGLFRPCAFFISGNRTGFKEIRAGLWLHIGKELPHYE